MSFRANILNLILAVLLMSAGCKDNATEPTPSATPSTLTGTIADNDYASPIVGAQIVDQGKIQANSETDNTGKFTISFGSLASQYTTVVKITASGYFDTLLVVSVEPGRDKTIPLVSLRRNSGQAITSNPEAHKAAQIKVFSPSATDIFISGVGELENSVIEFEVRDSLGLPVAKLPRYGATFSIDFFPNVIVGGGSSPRVIPAADSTDVKGRLRVSIVSGTQAGVVKVVARIFVDSIKIIKSEPVEITGHVGFPDQNHFTILTSRFVFPSMDYLYVPYTQFTVAVGDTFSNPVPEGTAIYFHTQAGIIQTGQQDFKAYTDKSGLASVGLLTVNPLPNTLPYYDATTRELGGRVGGHWVYAQTQGRNGKTIFDSILVIWNQAPILVGFEGHAPSTNPSLDSMITMPAHGISRELTMEVTDANGNPLCDGTTISAAIKFVDNSLTGLNFDVAGSFSSDHPATIPNAGFARFPGYGITNFKFQVVDNSQSTLHGSVTLVLTIHAPGIYHSTNEDYTISKPVTVY